MEKVQYSFLDYISGGFELNFMVAVDFTGINRNNEVQVKSTSLLDLFLLYFFPHAASNGSPHLPNSLHFIDPSGQLNAYQQV